MNKYDIDSLCDTFKKHAQEYEEQERKRCEGVSVYIENFNLCTAFKVMCEEIKGMKNQIDSMKNEKRNCSNERVSHSSIAHINSLGDRGSDI